MTLRSLSIERRREHWFDWFHRTELNGRRVDPFPMQISPPARRTVAGDFEQAVRSFEYFGDGRANCYYGFYPEELKAQQIVDCIWFDVDYNDDFRNKINIAAKTIDTHLESNRLPFRRLDSANRGLHYYILIRPVKLKNPNYCIGQWMATMPQIPPTVKYIKGKAYPAWGYDKHSGNLEQLVRVPYTVNIKTGIMAVESYGKVDFMPEPEVRPWEVAPNVHAQLLKYDREAPKAQEYSKQTRVMIKDWAPCIYDAIEMLQTAHPDKPHHSIISHDQSRHLAAFLYRVGMNQDAIVALFSRRPDFNERKARYQVGNIIGRGLLPNKCQTARKIGLCPEKPADRFKWCPFYPNVMYVIRNISEEEKHQVKINGKT